MQAPGSPPWPTSRILLLLAATETASVEGISAAGASPRSRRQTAAADAELLLLGPLAERAHGLPPLPAGVTPALISHVVLRDLGLLPHTQVVDLGCPVAPAIPPPAPACPGGRRPGTLLEHWQGHGPRAGTGAAGAGPQLGRTVEKARWSWRLVAEPVGGGGMRAGGYYHRPGCSRRLGY